MKKISAEKLLWEVRNAIITPPGRWKIECNNKDVVSVEAKYKRMSLLISCEHLRGSNDVWDVSASMWCGISDDYLFYISDNTLPALLKKVCKRLRILRECLGAFAPHAIMSE